jgi:hypothetical protein
MFWGSRRLPLQIGRKTSWLLHGIWPRGGTELVDALISECSLQQYHLFAERLSKQSLRFFRFFCEQYGDHCRRRQYSADRWEDAAEGRKGLNFNLPSVNF